MTGKRANLGIKNNEITGAKKAENVTVLVQRLEPSEKIDFFDGRGAFPLDSLMGAHLFFYRQFPQGPLFTGFKELYHIQVNVKFAGNFKTRLFNVFPRAPIQLRSEHTSHGSKDIHHYSQKEISRAHVLEH